MLYNWGNTNLALDLLFVGKAAFLEVVIDNFIKTLENLNAEIFFNFT